MKQQYLINILNPVIRGWVNYHKYNVSTEMIEKLDYEIWEALWRWCRRRHPNKGTKGIKEKYINDVENREWTFSVPIKGVKG